MNILPFISCRQAHNYDCGAAALQAVLGYYGIYIPLREAIHMAKTSPAHGTSIAAMVDVLHSFGFRCTSGRITIEKIKSCIDGQVPVIVPLQAWTKKKRIDWKKTWNEGHYVVVIGYDKEKLYFADPASKKITYLTPREFMRRWHDSDDDGRRYIHYGIAVAMKMGMQKRKARENKKELFSKRRGVILMG